MTQDSLITEEMRRAIGYQTEPTVIEVDKTVIKRLVEAVEDSNPLWQDEEKARASRWGGIVAPPSLLCAMFMIGKMPFEPITNLIPKRQLIDGGGEWEIYQPIHPGDTITVVSRLSDLAERSGRTGPMLLITVESSWRNQREEFVAKYHATAIIL